MGRNYNNYIIWEPYVHNKNPVLVSDSLSPIFLCLNCFQLKYKNVMIINVNICGKGGIFFLSYASFEPSGTSCTSLCTFSFVYCLAFFCYKYELIHPFLY